MVSISSTRRTLRIGIAACAGILALAVAGCGGSGGGSSSSSSSTAAASTNSTASTAANASGGHPNLSGQTIGFVIASLSRMDTVSAYMLPQILRSWGATVNVTQLSGSAVTAAQAVIAGRADLALEDVGTLIDGHLIAIGPSQPRVDYVLVSAPGITKIKELVGKVVTISDPKGIDGLIMRTEFTNAGMNPDSVQYQIVASTSQRASALLAGRGSATEVHISNAVTLGNKLTDLVTAASEMPNLADSYLGASPSWVASHPALVTAIDEAWIEAVHQFNTDPSAWIDGAAKYDPTAPPAGPLYPKIKAANLWPDNCVDGFTPSILSYNESIAVKSGAANESASLSTWTSSKYWDQAVQWAKTNGMCSS
jgi:hypothetical protein